MCFTDGIFSELSNDGSRAKGGRACDLVLLYIDACGVVAVDGKSILEITLPFDFTDSSVDNSGLLPLVVSTGVISAS